MDLFLRYNAPAENSEKGWEEHSIPVGNGYMGANIFGGIECDRIQITENSLLNPGEGDANFGGLNNFAEIYIKFGHSTASEYERGLKLNNAVAYTRYNVGNAGFYREYFASYPDKVLAIKLTGEEKSDFEICPEIPFIKPYFAVENDNGGKSGTVEAVGDTIFLAGKMEYYNILFEGQVKVISDGKIESKEKSIFVKDACNTVILVAVGTNYKLCEDVFLTDDRLGKTLGEDPHKKVTEYIEDASNKPYEALLKRHSEDFSSYFDRVELDLGEEASSKTTEELLDEYKNGKPSRYLEVLYFQYGRYLLISSSRKGCLPANLQGIWNCHDVSPWGSGYWHNVNVQMNYWLAFSTNLLEMFIPYSDYFMAFLPKAKTIAEEYIKKNNPENYKPGECGCTVGTAAYPYYITAPGRHSGPGTIGYTSKLFWDYFEFTQDKEYLKNVAYEVLKETSEFLTKTVKNYDGEYLATFSASPEQMHNGWWLPQGAYYQTVGCAFDQQFIYENGKDFIKAAEILGRDSESLNIQKEQIDKYSPVRIGWSGQVKEYIEENFYGEIGEYKHRHISQLMALHPGTTINSDTDAWMDAARYTLTERGDESTGWALALRLNMWARCGDGNHSYKLFQELLRSRTNPNLWDEHPPFQIDGNFGATAGVAEMLLQSHEGYIHILPSLPDCWDKGSVSGLTARGGFLASIEWENGCAKKVRIKSLKGETVRVKAKFAEDVLVSGAVSFAKNGNIIEFESTPGAEYVITGFSGKASGEKLSNFSVSNELELSWTGGECDILRAVDGAPKYECIAKNASSPYKDEYDFENAEIITYKIVRGDNACTYTINHSTKLQRDILKNVIDSRRLAVPKY